MPLSGDSSRLQAAPCRLVPGVALLLLLLTAGYLALMLFYPPGVRYGLLAAVVLSVVFLWVPRPSSWLMALPVLLLFGSSNVAIGDFFPALLTILLFVFFAFYAVDKLIWNDPLPPLAAAHRLVLLALLLQAASIAISIHVHDQHPLNALREGSGPFLFLPLAFIVPDLCRDRERLLRLSRACTLGLLVAGAVGVLQYFSISGFSRIDLSLGFIYRGRVASLLGNANVYAAYLEMTTPFVLALGLWERSPRWKVLSLAAVLLGTLGVLYTFSRGGLLSLALGCGLVLVLWYRRRLWLPVVILGLFLILLLRNAETFERQMSFFLDPESQLTQPSLLHRYITYQGLWHDFSEAPLTGIGWGAREFFWGRTQIYTFWTIRHAASSTPIATFGGLNSILLSFAVKGGLVSLTSLLLLTVAVVAAFRRGVGKAAFPWLAGISAGLLGLAIHQMMDNFLQWPQVSCHFWLYLGILIAAGRLRPS